ncbi:MAG TPA: protein translocase subunit SecF [Campylobacterales bacterium]|nr:protein translocase subunit SecF [Campylobacterales bacterium]
MEVFKYDKSVQFMNNAKKFGIFSLILIVASLTLLFTKGLNFGIDFAGGTIIQVKYEGDAPIEQVRSIISEHEKYTGATVTKFGDDSEIVIRTKQASKSVEGGAKAEFQVLLKDTGNFEIRRIDLVGPSVGEELKTKGIMAMIFAILGILIYISFRFEWRFAIASIAALMHDVTISMGMLALFQVEVNLPILAAILTILGYSLNDTVIVFDRIREGIRTIKSPQLEEVINESVTRTLSRTTLTSLTTFFVVLTLFLFGGEIIHGFSFTLLVGVVVGTYSSIFVASPILMWLKFSIVDFREKEAAALKRQKERDKQRAQFEQGTI